MTLRPRILTLLVLAALTGPAAAARADDTGTGGAQPTTPPQAPVVPGGLLGGQVQWQGTVAQGTQSAAVQRLDPASGSWTTIVTVPVAADGSFTASWLGDALGSYTVRAVPADGSQQQASTADAPPTARVTVFRGAKATWYGPGLFGKRTACGQRLTRSLVGVAHRRLPCGTPVEIYYA